MNGRVNSKDMSVDCLESLRKFIALPFLKTEHRATFRWIFEEQPVYAHPFVVRHQMVAVTGLRQEYVVWKYGVCFSFTFKH